jgi:hypothetical protein
MIFLHAQRFKTGIRKKVRSTGARKIQRSSSGKRKKAMSPKMLLGIAAGLSFAVAMFQTVISFSPSWSLYFGAPEELVNNIPMLYVAGLTAVLIFAVFGLYGLAGAGRIRSLPLLRTGLVAIGSIYTLRGLLVIPLLLTTAGILPRSEAVRPQDLASSLVSLFIGVLYLTGTMLGWRELPSRTKR